MGCAIPPWLRVHPNRKHQRKKESMIGFEAFSTLDAIRANQKEKSPVASSRGSGITAWEWKVLARGPDWTQARGTPSFLHPTFASSIGQLETESLRVGNGPTGCTVRVFHPGYEDRIVELDKIKSRVQQMEAKLKTRLDRRLARPISRSSKCFTRQMGSTFSSLRRIAVTAKRITQATGRKWEAKRGVLRI